MENIYVGDTLVWVQHFPAHTLPKAVIKELLKDERPLKLVFARACDFVEQRMDI